MSDNRDRAGELMHRLTFDASWDGAMSLLADALDEAEERGRQEWEANTARTAGATFRERYELQRRVEAVRRLADEMDREDPQVSTFHIARRIRAALTEEAS